MWTWYEWKSLEDFNSWHELIKKELGYPLPSFNQATGEIADPEATKEYTSATLVDDKWIARVETDYAEGLTLTELRMPEISLS